jgi:hypothetical protein
MVQLVRRVRPFGGLLFALWRALLLPVSTTQLHTQTSSDMATIEGTVLDPDGKAVVNAAVVVRHTLSGDESSTSTGFLTSTSCSADPTGGRSPSHGSVRC